MWTRDENWRVKEYHRASHMTARVVCLRQRHRACAGTCSVRLPRNVAHSCPVDQYGDSRRTRRNALHGYCVIGIAASSFRRVRNEQPGQEVTRGDDFGDEWRYDSSTTVPAVDQEICRRVETRVANIGEDANRTVTGHGPVTKANGERHDSASVCGSSSSSTSTSSNVSWNMTTIKGSGTPGAPRQLNVLSNFKYEYFVAGISGGVVSTLMLHPLDLIKIRFAGESRVRRTWTRSQTWRLAVSHLASRVSHG